MATLAWSAPASAHETVTTVAPGAEATAVSAGAAGGGMGEAAVSDAALSLPLVLTAAALAPLVALLAVSVGLSRNRRRGRPSPAQVAAAALLFTGVAHVAATPSHWAEGWHLGLFFAASGLVLLGQSVIVWRKPSGTAYASVIATTTALIVLYFVTRQWTLPFVDHRDPYLFEELPVKVAEGIAAVLSLATLVQVRSVGFRRNHGVVAAGAGVS